MLSGVSVGVYDVRCGVCDMRCRGGDSEGGFRMDGCDEQFIICEMWRFVSGVSGGVYLV